MQHIPIGETPFNLAFRIEAIKLLEVGLPSFRIEKFNANMDLLEEKRQENELCFKWQLTNRGWIDTITQELGRKSFKWETSSYEELKCLTLKSKANCHQTRKNSIKLMWRHAREIIDSTT